MLKQSQRLLSVLLTFLIVFVAACSSTTSTVNPGGTEPPGTGQLAGATPVATPVATPGKIVLELPSFQYSEVPTNTWWKALISAYQTAHPNVTIEFEDAPSANYSQTLAARFAAGSPPQLVHMITRDFSSFASQGWFDEIDSCFKDNTLTKLTALQSYMNYKGQTLGLLLNSYAYHLFYNKALLAKAGVAVPTTVDELASAAKAVHDKTGVIGYAGPTATTDVKNVVEVSIFLTGLGVPWTVNGKYNVTSPEFQAAIEKYRTVLKAAPQGTTAAQIQNTLFPTGKVAMVMNGNFYWSVALAAASADVKGSLAMASIPFPTVAGSVSNSLHIPKGLAPAIKQAACDFIALAASPTWQASYGQTLNVPPPAGIGVMPADYLTQHPEIALMAEQASKAKSILPTDTAILSNYGVFTQIVINADVALTTTDQPTAQILQKLSDDLNKQIPLGS